MYSILLAAGLSKRMGRQKLLLPFGESTVIETVIENLRKAELFPICAVFSKEVAEKISIHSDFIKAAINTAPERGQSSSLGIGLDMIPDGEDFCIMLGDLPLAQPAGMAKLREAFKNRPAGVTVLSPSRNGVFGHPMFYSAIWKERFKEAEGDAGGRTILTRHSDEIVTVEAADAHFKDIDTPEDYKKLAGAE